MDGIFTKNDLRKDNISINFNEAKQIAKDGGLSNIRITEASGAAFVLKEIGNAPASGIMGNLYPFEEAGTAKDAVAAALPDNLSDTANRITEDDSEALEEDGMSIERYDRERLNRLLEARKTARDLEERTLESAKLKLSKEREDAELEGKRNVLEKADPVYSFIAERLMSVNLPATESNVARIAEAVTMAGEAQFMTDASFSYLIENRLEPTVGNVYKAVHAGSGAIRPVKAGDLDQLKPDIDRVIESAGLEVTGETEAQALGIIESGIPLTAENLVYREELENIRDSFKNGRISNASLAETAAATLKRGYDPKNMNLSAAVKREEIRLLETSGAAAKMRELGIEPDLEAMTARLEELKVMEREASKSLITGLENEDELKDVFERTLNARDDIEAAGEALPAAVFDVRRTITLTEISVTARGLTAKGAAAAAAYEAGATKIRSDLGDSISKAFAGIDGTLSDMGLETSEANRRAVRMLGYNSIEITPENISEMKYFDAEIETLKQNLKPQVTAEIIKRGINPLSSTVRELSRITGEVAKELGKTPEERFSEYLVKLDRRHEITPEQRESYIGIYRMLYSIDKTDGAAIGALVKSGRELTLSNLLTESRTYRRRSMDVSVDDAFGGYERTETPDLPIDRQVAAAYAVFNAADAYRNADPGRLAEAERRLRDKGRTLGDVTVEELAEELKTTETDSTDRAYDAERLNAFRSTLAEGDGEAAFLKAFGLDDSAVNIRAAASLFGFRDGTGRLNDLRRRKANADHAQASRTEPAEDHGTAGDVHGLSEVPETEEELKNSLTGQILTAAALMDSLYAAADLTGREARELTSLKNLAELKNALISRRFYDIPLEDEDGILNVHLTLAHEGSTQGRFEVSTEGITALGTVQGDEANVIIAATGETERALRSDGSLEESLRAAGFEKAFVAVSRGEVNSRLKGDGTAETAKLYTAARETVLYLRKIIKMTGETE